MKLLRDDKIVVNRFSYKFFSHTLTYLQLKIGEDFYL